MFMKAKHSFSKLSELGTKLCFTATDVIIFLLWPLLIGLEAYIGFKYFDSQRLNLLYIQDYGIKYTQLLELSKYTELQQALFSEIEQKYEIYRLNRFYPPLEIFAQIVKDSHNYLYTKMPQFDGILVKFPYIDIEEIKTMRKIVCVFQIGIIMISTTIAVLVYKYRKNTNV